MNRRALSTLALLATTGLASAGTASAAPTKALPTGTHTFYRDGSVLPVLRPAFVSRAQAKAAAKKRKKSKAPVVTKVSPMTLKVGEKLSIYGKNFLPGKGKTKVFFLRVGHPGAAWVRSTSGSKTKVVVTVPASLNKLIPANGQATRFQIRVLAKGFGKATRTSRSPLISTTPGAGSGSAGSAAVSGPTTGVGACTPNFNDPTVDSDKDLIPDVREHQIGTDPCNKDTDGDGVEDGYEYYSALDLNSNALPYPWKLPYPNALFPDATTDYDGDGLTLGDEFSLWIAFGNHQLPLNYSDGKQTTVPQAAPSCATIDGWALDFNCDGQLDDGERDADGDGLSNWSESHGPMMGQSWWTSVYKDEKAYPVTFAGTNMLDWDTDGDGLKDGWDDQDHDGYDNQFETYRPGNWGDTYVSSDYVGLPGMGDGSNWTAPAVWGGTGTLTNPTAGGNTPDPYARVNPFNPCKPLWSSICHEHPPIDYYPPAEDWAAPTQAQVQAAGAPAPGQIP